jgi:hypothetical protein
VYLVTTVFAVVMVQWHNDPQTNADAAAEWVVETPQRAWDQYNEMWRLATDEQRAYLCDQYLTTDGEAIWHQAVADNGISYDGFTDTAANRDQWNQYLAARCTVGGVTV